MLKRSIVKHSSKIKKTIGTIYFEKRGKALIINGADLYNVYSTTRIKPSRTLNLLKDHIKGAYKLQIEELDKTIRYFSKLNQ